MEQDEPADDLDGLPPQEKVAAVFRLAGYEVEQRVGAAPGTVDWFAVPRTGFLRPQTFFRALPNVPESPEAVLAELEGVRNATGADRAIAVVMDGGLPSGYEPDLARSASNLLTFRRWFLEVSGVADSMSEIVRRTKFPHLYLPRRARLASGEEVQVEPFLDEWSQAEPGPTVAIQGGKYSGKDTVLYYTVYRAALRYMERPETTRLLSVADDDLTERAISLGFVLPAVPSARAEDAPLDRRSLVVWGQELATRLEEEPDALDAGAVTLRLIEPHDDEIELWYERHLGKPALYHLLREARRSNGDFSALTRRLLNLPRFFDAIRAQDVSEVEPASGDAWIAAVMISYLRRIESEMDATDADEQWTLVEDLAMREFALGSLGENVQDIDIDDDLAHDWIDDERSVFRSELVRDLFLSKKIIREIQAGNDAVLFRHQFPRWTLLYLILRAYRLGESIRLEVRDNGEGVPPADRERIFDPLITTKTGGSGKPRGTGLGLAIARRYVECMGGRVGLDPTSGETCFYVDLVAWRDDLVRREDG